MDEELTTEERLLQLEERFTRLSLQQLQYPLDKNTQEIIRNSIKTELVDRLFPVQTDDANEGVEELVDFNPTWQLADAATKTCTFFYIIPRNTGIKDMELIWATPAASGNMKCQVDISAGNVGEEVATRTTGGTAFIVATVGADTFNYTSLADKGGTQLWTLKSDDIVGIKFSRIAGDGADTLDDQVNIYGMKLTLI